MQISDRINRARVSATIRLSETARELQRAGHEIIDLAEGEPDFDTPYHITVAAFEAARRGATRYTDVAGTPELRDAVARHFKSRNGPDCKPNNVIVGTGAKQLIFNALMSSVNRGDEVIIPVPCWVSYADMAEIADGLPVLAKCGADTGFKLTDGGLEELITSRTRWLILNSPCNPTGIVYSRDELSALAVVLRRHPGVAVICDDIYQEIVFDGAAFATLAAVAPDLSDRILTVHGVSKTYAMTGWRIGYAAGPPDLISAMTKLQGQSTTNVSSVSQAAALAALNGPHGAAFATLAAVAPDLSDRILTVHGVSKTYAMTGWRIGYAAGPPDLISAMTKLQGQSTTNASSVSQAAALAALNGPQDFLVNWRAAYRRRRDLVAAQLAGIPGLEFTVPRGAFYHFADCSGLLGKATPAGRCTRTDEDLSLYLLESAGVATVPGTAFAAPGHVRLCFARSEDQLAQACGRIRKGVELLVD